MTKSDLSALIAQATAAHAEQGGAVKQCAEGDTAVRQIPRTLWQCQCGCHGDFTDHSMRAGESGRDASIIIY